MKEEDNRMLSNGVRPSDLPDRAEEYPREFMRYDEHPAGYGRHPRITPKTRKYRKDMQCPKCLAHDWHRSVKRTSRWVFYLWCVCLQCGFRTAFKPADAKDT